jgi:hypothetical protein
LKQVSIQSQATLIQRIRSRKELFIISEQFLTFYLPDFIAEEESPLHPVGALRTTCEAWKIVLGQSSSWLAITQSVIAQMAFFAIRILVGPFLGVNFCV